MAQDATLAWLRQFACADDQDDAYTHVIDKTLYSIPSRQLGSFYAKIQALIGFGRRAVRERVPELTPAFFTFVAPAPDRVTSDEAVSALAQTGLEAILAGEYRTDSAPHGDGGSGVPSKVCVVLRTPPHTNEAGDEVEAFTFLYPRLLVKREGQEGESPPLAVMRARVLETFAALSEASPDLVDWDLSSVLAKDETPKVLMAYGSSGRSGIAKSFFRAYDDRGDVIDLEDVFDAKECALPSAYAYSLSRLARRVERAAELSPELKAINELLRLVGTQRLDESSDVLAIAQALYAASKGSAEGELILEEFLATTGGSGVADRAHELWQEVAVARPRYTTMTLRYMASRDNPLLFKRLVQGEIKEHLWKSTGPHGSHLDLAHVLKGLYGHVFAYDHREEAWYHYEDTHWTDDAEMALRERLRTQVLAIYEDLYEQIARLAQQSAENEAQAKAYKERAKRCGGWIKSLGSKEKNAIIGEAADLFVVPQLTEKMDGPISYATFAFADCVFNMIPDAPERSTFSDGRPEDFCKRSSPVMMRRRGYSMEHPDVRLLMGYLRQVLASYDEDDEPDESVLWYMVDRTAVCLEGGNRLKHLTIGEGPRANNSKSTYESIVHDGMGGYSSTISTGKVVGKSRGNADGPTTSLTHCQGARALWIKETSKGERLNAGQILEMTSGLDPIAVRDMYAKRMREVIPSYKMMLLVNNSPRLDADEPGLWIRVRWVLWLSQFVEAPKAPKDEREQRRQRTYPIDPGFAKKRVAMVAPMMWLLCERYKVSGRYGPEEPEAVLGYAKKHRDANDVFGRYLKDCTEEADGASVDADALYDSFALWWKRRHQQSTYYSQDDLTNYLAKHHSEPKWGTTWEGFRLRPTIQRVAARD
jgi:hypothetical protein